MAKNLIYIFADQLRRSAVGFNGDEKAITPNIDAFASECTNMVNAVSGHPVCAPYRASLFTGKYTTSTGMVINEIRISQNHRTFANVLSDAGYETCYIGKWHMYANKLGDHYNPQNSFIPKGERLGFNDFFAAYNFHHEYYAPKAYYHLDTDEKIYADKYEPDAQTDMAIEHISRLSKGEKPFAMFLSLGTPHDPWTKENVPTEYYEMFKDVRFEKPINYKPENDEYADGWARMSEEERDSLEEWMRCYYAMTANLDYNFGRLINAIDSLGLKDNTVVIFTSDHGEMFGAQGRRAKNIFYEEAVRVPFFIRGTDFRAYSCDANFNTVDIMPTLLSYMGLEIPSDVEGVNRLPEINGEIESDQGSLMMGTGRTAVWGSGNEWRAIRTKKYTYAIYKRDGKELLFDNISDPYQMTNLASKAEYSDILSALKNEMYEMMNKIGDDFEDNSFYKENWVEDRIILPYLKRRSEL